MKMFLARKMTSLYREKREVFLHVNEILTFLKCFHKTPKGLQGNTNQNAIIHFRNTSLCCTFKLILVLSQTTAVLRWRPGFVQQVYRRQRTVYGWNLIWWCLFQPLWGKKAIQKFQSEILWPVRDTGYRAGFLVALRSADLSASHEHSVGEGLVESKELH